MPLLMILLLVFGASRLPQLGEGLGRAIRNLKRSVGGEDAGPSSGESQAAKAKSEAADAELVDRDG